jgi:hypothetical protein
MSTSLRVLLAGCAMLAIATPARAQFGDLSSTTAALSVSIPVGDLETLAQTGYGIVLRQGMGEPNSKWFGRGSFGFDYFKGNGVTDNVQYIVTGLDLVHRTSSAFYQYGGLGLNNTRITTKSSSGVFNNRSEQNFQLSAGAGVNFGEETGTRWFLEFSAVTVFSGRGNLSSFPIRIGMKF